MSKVAIVTGANKGIGFEIVTALCKSFDGDVVLTARDVQLGNAAIKSCEKVGLFPKMLQLDITSMSSVTSFAEQVKTQYGGVDILVNNAGIYLSESNISLAKQADPTFGVNFTGTKRVCDAMWPLLRPQARVVILSSMLGNEALARISGQHRSKLLNPAISMEELQSLMDGYLSAVKLGKHEEQGWAGTPYDVSKLGCTLLARVLQREASRTVPEKDLVINACCPGYCATDMTNNMGYHTAEQGAETPVYLALLPKTSDVPRGELLSNKQVIPWK